MSRQRIATTGTITAPLIGKYRKGLPRTSREPYAAYLWGSQYGTTVTEDVSANGRTLTAVGAAFVDEGTSIRHGSTGSYFTCPFNADSLSNSGPVNELTMLFFGRVSGTGLITWFQTNGVSGVTRRTNFLTGTSYDVLANVSDGVSDPSIISPGGKSAWRETNAGMFGLVGTMYNRYVFSARDGGNFNYPNPPAPPVGDVSARAIGGNPATTRLFLRADGTSLNAYASGALIYDYALSDGDIAAAYIGMRALYASYGLAI